VVVLDRKEEIEHLAAALRDGFGKLIKLYATPFGRAMIRFKRGPEVAHALKSHVIGIARENNAWHARNGADRYLYGAPVVLLFHSTRWRAGYQESGVVAATYAMLAAHSLGLGCTLLSIVPPIINNMGKSLRPRYGIPDGNAVVIAAVLGYPKHKFRRIVRRKLKSVRYV
jgi:hypothetical protein